jgi:hypothetical protein
MERAHLASVDLPLTCPCGRSYPDGKLVAFHDYDLDKVAITTDPVVCVACGRGLIRQAKPSHDQITQLVLTARARAAELGIAPELPPAN